MCMEELSRYKNIYIGEDEDTYTYIYTYEYQGKRSIHILSSFSIEMRFVSYN